MGSVEIVDTSVLCNILGIPGRDQQRAKALGELKDRLERGVDLLLPLAAVFEIGRFIAQLPQGVERRHVAESFVEQVRQAVRGDAPWTPTPLPSMEDLERQLRSFPDQATKGLSLADASIIDTWRRQKKLHRERDVFIWSYDRHLRSYGRV